MVINACIVTCGSPHWRPMHGRPYGHIHTGRCDMAPPDGIWVALPRPAYICILYDMVIVPWCGACAIRHANQAGRHGQSNTQIPSDGTKPRRLMCMWPCTCPCIGRIRPAGFHYLAWPAAHIMHARICKRHVNQAGRDKATQIPSDGTKPRRLMCMWPCTCPCIGRIRPPDFQYLAWPPHVIYIHAGVQPQRAD